MKKNDILVIAVVAIFSGFISLMAANLLFIPKKTKQLTAQKVDPITADFKKPDNRFFNENAINPTKLIQIGDSNNTEPF